MQQAEELYRCSPLDTRYSIKYRHVDGKLVFKVTDDKVCLQFRTDQQQDLKKLERITTMFFALFSSGELPQGEAHARSCRMCCTQQDRHDRQGMRPPVLGVI